MLSLVSSHQLLLVYLVDGINWILKVSNWISSLYFSSSASREHFPLCSRRSSQPDFCDTVQIVKRKSSTPRWKNVLLLEWPIFQSQPTVPLNKITKRKSGERPPPRRRTALSRTVTVIPSKNDEMTIPQNNYSHFRTMSVQNCTLIPQTLEIAKERNIG